MPRNRPLTILLVAYLTLGLVYDQATPIFESSDEVWHYGMVRELAEGHGLPVQEAGVLTAYRQEGSQTPVYYVVAAALTFWIDASDFEQRYVYNPFGRAGVPGTPVNANMMRHSTAEAFPWSGVTLAVHLLRWFSLLLGIGTILLTHRIAALLFPHRPALALLAAAFTAFNPMFLFISAAVNNDNGLWLVSTLAIYLIALAARNEVEGSGEVAAGRIAARLVSDRWLPWTLGLALSLAIMVKLSGLVLAPVVGLFLLWRARRRGDWRGLVRQVAIVGACVAVLAGWWFVRNYALYDEWLGVRMMRAIVGVERPRPATVIDLLNEVQGWWFSLWGVFGAFSVLPGQWVFGVYTGLTLLAVAGGVLSIRRGEQPRSVERYAPHAFALAFMALTFVGIVWWTYTQYASQGRLVLGAIGPLSTFLAAGLLTLLAPRRVAHTIAAGLFVIALIIPFRYIMPIYQPPPTLVESELPADLQPVRATIGERIELLGYTIDAVPHRPGDVLDVTLFWRARASIARDYNLALNVHGREFELVGKLDTWPGGGLLPTSEWAPGVIYADSYPLPLADAARAPTLLRLDVTFWQDELSNRLPLRAPDGSLLPSLILDVGWLAPAMPASPTPDVRDGSTLEGGFTLLGYDLPARAAPGETVEAVLYWEAHPSPAPDYTVFVHLRDADGNTVAQADGPPLGGDWPTSAWVHDGPVADPHRLPISADLPPGEYTLAVGLYDPDSGERLPAFKPSGEEWRDRAIRLSGAITVP